MRYLILVLLFLFGCASQPIECSDQSCEGQMGVTPAVQGVPIVQVLPKIGWSQGADFVPGSGQLKAVFQAQFPEAGNYTIQFNVNDPNGTNLSGTVGARAIINWKVNGNPVTRVVDVGTGVSVTGVGESVDVQIQDISIITGGTVKPYTITVSCAPGCRPTVQQPPTVAFPIDTILPGQNVVHDVPKGAISVMVVVFPSVIGGTIGAYQIEVGQLNAQSTVLKAYDPRQSDWVPLVSGTTKLIVATDGALVPNVLSQVTFGIDG